MIVHLIIGQRREAYPGEFAPEVLDVCDEHTMEENPDLLLILLCKHREKREFEAVESVAVEVPLRAIMERLRPPAPLPIPAVVLNEL